MLHSDFCCAVDSSLSPYIPLSPIETSSPYVTNIFLPQHSISYHHVTFFLIGLCNIWNCRRTQQCHLIYSLAFHSFSYSRSTTVWKQMMLFLTYCQDVNGSLTLDHNAYVIHLRLSHRVGTLATHILTRRGRVNTVQ